MGKSNEPFMKAAEALCGRTSGKSGKRCNN